MKEPNTLVEYGAAIDPRAMVVPPDVTELELEPGHPGEHDAEYVARRKELFALCRKHRLERLGPPILKYNAEETRILREVAPTLHELGGHDPARRPGARAQAVQLVQHRVRADRGAGRDEGVRGGHPVEHGRDPALAVLEGRDPSAVRDRHGHRYRLRPVADAEGLLHRK